ncbi:MAG: archaemetzincin family Zn-dependent metalloprotease [Ignavibacteria bacterium]
MNIFIAPVEFSNTQLIHNVIEEIHSIFNVTASIVKLPLNINPAFSTDREQYFSTQLLADTIKLTGHLDGKVLTIVEFDLFVPVFTYIFGEAQLNGKHSIVSVCRLHEEFYSGNTNYRLLLERTSKEVLHELGHNFGLIHCKNWDCVMHQSQGVEEIDIKGTSYCLQCMNAIKINELMY